jgi:CRISPR-associated protein Csx16
MTTYFVTRHAGAKQWATELGLTVDDVIEHLRIEDIEAGDLVLGSLPINLVAELNEKGARYFHLSLELTEQMRGIEITAVRMRELGAKLEEFSVHKIKEEKKDG